MILITSAAYASQELQSEIGSLPPAFLPVGNRRLYALQLERLPRDEPTYLSVPSDFVMDTTDLVELERHQVGVIYVPGGLSLADSLTYCINFVGSYTEPIRILHGDTLIDGLDGAVDVIVTGRTSDNYQWQVDEEASADDHVWAGYFAFADSALFLRCLTRSHHSFVDAVKLYDHERALEKRFTERWLDFGHLNTYYRSRSWS
jgi:hypothetical protein